MILDIRTVLFSYLLTCLACVVVYMLLWMQNRRRFEGMTFWLFSFICQALVLILLISRGLIPDWVSVVLANILILLGAFLGYAGLLRFVRMKLAQVHNYVILALLPLVQIYFTYVQPDLAARIFIMSIGLLIFCFQGAWLLLYRVPVSMRPLTRSVGVVLALYGLVSIGRILGLFTGGRDRIDFFQQGWSDAGTIIAYQILTIFLAYTLALMFNKRLLMDISTQEEKFSKAFHSSPNAINLTRLSDGLILEANAGFLKISGYRQEEVSGKTVTDLGLWAHDEDRMITLKELKSSGAVRDREFQFRIQSGGIITGLFSAEIITINDEPYILSSINDISARKLAEENLKKSNIYLERLNNALTDAIFVVNYSQQTVEYLNDAAITLFGYSKKEVLEDSLLKFYPDQEAYLRINAIFQDTLEQRKNLVRFETILKKKSGNTFPAFLTATFLRENEKVAKCILIVQDITEQKRDNEVIRQLNVELEQRVTDRTRELRDSQMALLNLVDDLNESTKNIAAVNRSLEAVNRELTAFNYSVSHDLRAPLRSIDGFSSALLEDYADRLDHEGISYLQRIRRATQNMGQLIDDLLSLSRVLKADFYPQPFDLSAMVHQITGDLQQRDRLPNLTLDIQDGIIVRADQRLISVAMTNLLENAWKFSGKTDHPHITFGMKIEDDETVYFIRDNGAGFNMAYVDKIFDAFQRLHRAEDFPGTGIGLATVQRIINRHGGRIRAQGEPGRGATFYFTLGA